MYKIIETLIYWKDGPKEEFDMVFKNIIFKTNEEILNEMSHEKAIQLARYVEEKMFKQHNENL